MGTLWLHDELDQVRMKRPSQIVVLDDASSLQ